MSIAVSRTPRVVYVATTGAGGRVYKVSVADGTDVLLARGRDNYSVEHIELALHPDGNMIAVAELNQGEVTALDVTGVELWTMMATRVHFSHVAFSPDGSRLFALGGAPPDGASSGVFIRTLATGNVQVVRLREPADRALLVAPAGDKVYALSTRSLHIVDTVTLTATSHELRLEGLPHTPPGQEFIRGAAISRDGRSIFVVSADRVDNWLRVLDIATQTFTGNPVVLLSGFYGRPGLAVSPNGRFLYIAGDPIHVIDTASRSVITTLRTPGSSAWSDAAFAELPAGCGTQDTDGDLVVDCVDNCRQTPNSGQHDSDGDAVGDVCDPCPADAVQDTDGDGLCSTDNCPTQANSDQTNSDGDGMGDACDKDDDNDGVPDDGDASGTIGDRPCLRGSTRNCDDNCRTTPNPDQADSELDASGNPVGDGVGDVCDNCRSVINPDQRDTDRDGQGDACDCDDDNDKVQDPEPSCGSGPYDNCQWVFNPDQLDLDQDGMGWACDPREQERFWTGKLWFDVQLEVLAEELEKNGFQWPWGPGEPSPCPYCEAAAPTEYSKGLALAQRYVKAHPKGKAFTREDVYAFLTKRDDVPLSKEIIRKLIEQRTPGEPLSPR